MERILHPNVWKVKIVPIKDGTASNGSPYRSFTCTNNEAGCDFFETKYGDLTPPGILVTEDMTAQDVENLREKRRRLKHGAPAPFAPPNPDLNYNLNREQKTIDEKIAELQKKLGLPVTPIPLSPPPENPKQDKNISDELPF